MACLQSCRDGLGTLDAEFLICAPADRALPEKISLPANPALRYFPVHSQSVGALRNKGLSEMTGETFLLLDEDCRVPDAHLISKIVGLANSSVNKVHGGSYFLKDQGYWAQVYLWVNNLWLKSGWVNEDHTVHLLGGFIFGSAQTASLVKFNEEMKWGGEEKEMLLRLKETHAMTALHHSDLQVQHCDFSHFSKFVKRAFRQGMAAGHYGLTSKNIQIRSLPWKYFPGLALFYFFSRLGILTGILIKLQSIFANPKTSPIP